MLLGGQAAQQPNPVGAEASEGTIIASLLFYLFVFFEDGQGFLTFLLFGLQSPASLLPRNLLSAAPTTPSRLTRRRGRRVAEADDSPVRTHGSRSTAGKGGHARSDGVSRVHGSHIPRSDSRDATNSPFMLRNLRPLGVPPRESLSGQATPSEAWSPVLRERWPTADTGSGSSLADLDPEAEDAAGHAGSAKLSGSSQGAAPAAAAAPLSLL